MISNWFICPLQNCCNSECRILFFLLFNKGLRTWFMQIWYKKSWYGSNFHSKKITKLTFMALALRHSETEIRRKGEKGLLCQRNHWKIQAQILVWARYRERTKFSKNCEHRERSWTKWWRTQLWQQLGDTLVTKWWLKTNVYSFQIDGWMPVPLRSMIFFAFFCSVCSSSVFDLNSSSRVSSFKDNSPKWGLLFPFIKKKKLISLYNCECYNDPSVCLKVSPYLSLTNFRKSTNERLGHHSGKFQTGGSNQLLILGLKKSYRRRTMPFFNTKRAFQRGIRLEKKLPWRKQLLCPATWVYSLL